MRLKRLVVASVTAALGITLWPTPADAQRRAVGRAQRAPTVIVRGGYVYPPYFYGPWGYPYDWYGQYRYGRRYVYDGASVRIQVTPKTAEVFVDGYFAGMVDEFDGTFQRLRVEPGEHEIAVFADGFRTLRHRLYLQPLGTINIKDALEPLAPGEVQEARPAPPVPVAGPAPGSRRSPPIPPRARTGPPNRSEPPPASPTDATFGTLSILVQPAGAEIFINGERWAGTGDRERLLVQLAPGAHRVEVRRSGYQTFAGTIDIRPGQTETLNVSLSRE